MLLTGTLSGTLPKLRIGQGLSQEATTRVWICPDRQARLSNPRVWVASPEVLISEKGCACCCSAEPPRLCRWTLCHVKDATLELRETEPKTCERWNRYKKAGRWHSAKSVRRCEKSGRVNQSWSELAPLVQAHCEHCNNLLPSVLLHGHASPTPPRLLRLFVIDLFSANTDLQQFFLNRTVPCAKTRSFFLMTTQLFRRSFKRFCASWQVVGPLPPASSLSVARNHRLLRGATRPW